MELCHFEVVRISDGMPIIKTTLFTASQIRLALRYLAPQETARHSPTRPSTQHHLQNGGDTRTPLR
jgi:hypothetical protein